MSDLDMRPTAAGDLAALDELGRIPFGPRPNQTLPPSWAAAMLTKLREQNPKVFGALLQDVAINGTDGSR